MGSSTCSKCGIDVYRKPSRILKYKTSICKSCDNGKDNALFPFENDEKWVDVPLYEEFIQVSNFGNVRTKNRSRSDGRIEPSKILSQKIKNNGYLEVSLRFNKTRKWFLVHRLVASAFLIENVDTECVNHKNGNKKDNRVDNLEYTTLKANSNHAVRTGLCKNEEKHYKAKLTREQVLDIIHSNKSDSELSQIYSVSISNINSIKRRRTWRYVDA
jgi:hypothetical protein